MQEQLITFETAKLAKEKGFSINTIEYWEYQKEGTERYKFITEDTPGATWVNDDLPNRICTSTQSLLQKWLREVHNIHITITSISQESWQAHITKPKEKLGENYIEDAYSYEEALEVGLQEALKLIEIVKSK